MLGPDFENGRAAPPAVRLMLAQRRGAGSARVIDRPAWRGPRGFATRTVRNRNQRIRFTVPGEYSLYCSIHPVLMSQVVKVR